MLQTTAVYEKHLADLLRNLDLRKLAGCDADLELILFGAGGFGRLTWRLPDWLTDH